MKTFLLFPIVPVLLVLRVATKNAFRIIVATGHASFRAEGKPPVQLKWQLANAVGADHSQKVWSGLHYDVTASNSLVTPYDGIIEATVNPDPADPKWIVMYRVKLGYRDGRWLITDMQGSDGWGLKPIDRNDELHWYKTFADHFGFVVKEVTLAALSGSGGELVRKRKTAIEPVWRAAFQLFS